MRAAYEWFAQVSVWWWPRFADHLWQTTLFVLVILAVVFVLRRSPARIRHSFYILAGAKFIIPATLFVFLAYQAGIAFGAPASLLMTSHTNLPRRSYCSALATVPLRPVYRGFFFASQVPCPSFCATIRVMHVLKVRSHQREELVEFTEEVQEKLTASGEQEGVVVLYVQHTTAGLTVNENADPDVPRDMLHLLRTLVPQHGMGFRHGEENSDAHIKATLVGSSVTIPFRGGKLLLGRWQGIFLCEFDGGRERQVIMMVR